MLASQWLPSPCMLQRDIDSRIHASVRFANFANLGCSYVCLRQMRLQHRRFQFWCMWPPNFNVLGIGCYDIRLLGIAQQCTGRLQLPNTEFHWCVPLSCGIRAPATQMSFVGFRRSIEPMLLPIPILTHAWSPHRRSTSGHLVCAARIFFPRC